MERSRELERATQDTAKGAKELSRLRAQLEAAQAGLDALDTELQVRSEAAAAARLELAGFLTTCMEDVECLISEADMEAQEQASANAAAALAKPAERSALSRGGDAGAHGIGAAKAGMKGRGRLNIANVGRAVIQGKVARLVPGTAAYRLAGYRSWKRCDHPPAAASCASGLPAAL